MRQNLTENSQRYIDCLELFLKQRGRNVTRIEREMRALGHHDFSRRILYNRNENNTHSPGWIERYDWRELLKAAHTGGNTTGRECAPLINAERGMRSAESGPPYESEPGAVATGFFRPQSRGRLKAGLTAPPKRSPEGGFTPALHSARVSTPLGDTPSHTIPRPASRIPPSFKAWLKRVSPNMRWDLPHLEYLYSRLKRVTDGSCKRLMIFMPPRHGKSETVTVRYTAWRIAQDPSMNVILGSYNQRLADRFSRKVRRVLADDAAVTLKETVQSAGFSPSAAGEATAAAPCGGHHKEIPHTAKHRNHANPCTCHAQERAEARTLNSFAQRPANTVSEWETTEGGTFRAVGVGAGVTGFGAKLIVIDDPVKSRAEAESETYRDKVHEWFNDDLYTRLEPDGAIILIQTRWHEDDLAGRLLKEMHDGGEHWDVVNLPALCEESAGVPEYQSRDARPPQLKDSGTPSSPNSSTPALNNSGTRLSPDSGTPALRNSGTSSPYDPIGRLPGEALWPSRYDEAALEKLRRKLGSYSFSSLYQQRPVPAEGGLFKLSWFKNIVTAPPPGLKWNRGYDLAVSTRTNACYTASARCAFDKDGNLYIADVMRNRMEFPEQRRYMIERIIVERDTEHGVELALHGHAIIQDLRREAQLRGRPFRGVKVDADKITRALGWANLAEEGKVILVRGRWNQEFLSEIREFPSGKFDDQIDAVSIAVRMCRHHKTRSFWSF